MSLPSSGGARSISGEDREEIAGNRAGHYVRMKLLLLHFSLQAIVQYRSRSTTASLYLSNQALFGHLERCDVRGQR
jgi:hypothetical protein